MIQQSYKYVRWSLCPCEKFFERKITKNVEISLGRLEKSELLWEPNFFTAIGVLLVQNTPVEHTLSCLTLSPSNLPDTVQHKAAHF